MDNLNVLEILKVGLPGLVFLLCLLSYRLFHREQSKPQPSLPVLRSIKQFMWLSFLFALLTATCPIIEGLLRGTEAGAESFNVEAEASDAAIPGGWARVCAGAPYAYRNLLIKDHATGKLVQPFAWTTIPCTGGEQIHLSREDAALLGWRDDDTAKVVEVVPAPAGCKFTI